MFAQANDQYLFPEPQFFVTTHLPLNPIWQMLEYPVSAKKFQEDDWDVVAYLRYREATDPYPIDPQAEIRKLRERGPVQEAYLSSKKGYAFHQANVATKAAGQGDYGMEMAFSGPTTNRC